MANVAKEVTCNERIASPTWKTQMQSVFCDAPLNRPRSHNDFVPVGSSSKLSFTLVGNLFNMFHI